MLKKGILILLSPFIATILVSCCDCMESVISTYSNCDLTVYNIDNSGPHVKRSFSTEINKEAYGIQIEILGSSPVCEFKPQNFLINSAYALSCDCPPEFVFEPLDSISSIRIKTINDFDSRHPAGSDVSNYFYVLKANDFFKIEDHISSSYNEVNSNVNSFDSKLSQLDLVLMTPPTIGTAHKFTVEVKLSDGRVLVKETQKVDLI